MTPHARLIRNRFFVALGSVARLSQWEREHLELMFEELTSLEGLPVASFSKQINRQTHTVITMLDKLVSDYPELITVVSEARPRIYRLKTQVLYQPEFEMIADLEAFKYTPLPEYSDNLNYILEQPPQRILQVLEFGTDVWMELNKYVESHDNDLTEYIKGVFKEKRPWQAVMKALEIVTNNTDWGRERG